MENKKMTKKETINLLIDVLMGNQEVEDMQIFIDFLTRERELLEKKSSKSTPTKTQLENENLKEVIVETLLEIDRPVSIAEIQKFCEEHGVILDVKYQTGTSYDAGTIFKQSRPEGYTVESGNTFIIYVAEDAPDEELEEEPSGCNELEDAC